MKLPSRRGRVALALASLLAVGSVREAAHATHLSTAVSVHVAAQRAAEGPLAFARTILASRAVEGVVVESIPAASYRYVHLIDADGRDTWVVGLGIGARVGDVVSFQPIATSRDFESPRLGRRFDRLVFVASLPGAQSL